MDLIGDGPSSLTRRRIIMASSLLRFLWIAVVVFCPSHAFAASVPVFISCEVLENEVSGERMCLIEVLPDPVMVFVGDRLLITVSGSCTLDLCPDPMPVAVPPFPGFPGFNQEIPAGQQAETPIIRQPDSGTIFASSTSAGLFAGPAGVEEVPTVSEMGLVSLVGLLALLGLFALRKTR
jgi:hypothetical protein